MIHTFQECVKFLLFRVCVNTMREIKRVLETIMAGDDETEVTEETIPAAVAVPIIVIIVIAIIVMVIVASIYIVRYNRYNTTIHDTDTLHVSYSCYYCPQTDLHMHHTLQIPL